MNPLSWLIDTDGFVPRWECGRWSDALGWAHIAADAGIGLAYFAIPLVIAYFLLRRRDIPFPGVLWLFVAFIGACGLGHLIESLIFWQPLYRLSAVVKVSTALVSWTTVLALVWIVPKVLTIPGVFRLNDELSRQIAEGERLRERLAQSEEQLRLTLEATSDGVWDWDVPADRLEFSESWRASFGLGPDRPPTREDWLRLVHPDDLPDLRRAMGRLGRGEEARVYHAYRVQPPGGGERWRLLAGRCVSRGLDGRPRRVLGTDTDITDRKRDEAERGRLEARVQHGQKLESLGVLAGGIAHDFNNLLTAMLGNASIALDQLPGDSPAREDVARIEDAAGRAAALCRQMLAYSGRGRFVVQPVDICEVVRDMARLLHVSIAKKAELRMELETGLPAVEADVSQLQQVVMNLITNASDAIGDRAGAITIRCGVVTFTRPHQHNVYLDYDLPPGRYAFVEVEDDGSGMDEETRGRLFDPFYSTKGAGRGLGLAAVLGIVRAHKGAIDCRSEVGAGTCFTVILPVTDRPARPLTGEPVPPTPAADTGGTVLVIDDEEVVRVVAANMLASAGFTVIEAVDGVQGLELYEEHKDELTAILLDMTMPILSGEEVALALRGRGCRVPIVLTSGYDEPESVARLGPEAVAGFIQKPYRLADFLSRLRAAVAAAGLAEQQQHRPGR